MNVLDKPTLGNTGLNNKFVITEQIQNKSVGVKKTSFDIMLIGLLLAVVGMKMMVKNNKQDK